MAKEIVSIGDPEPDGGGRSGKAGTGPSTRVIRDATAVITYADESMIEVLGWRPEQLVGRPSTEFIHPEDQPSAIMAWFAMREQPGANGVWVGRYRASDGGWRWIESANVNHLHDPENPVVHSTLTLVTPKKASLEEELLARKQIISRLSDALPVGVLQIDEMHRVTFTNDRLHTILAAAPAATAEAQFANVIKEDRPAVDAAITAALAGERVHDLEIRLRTPAASRWTPNGDRVCVFSLRGLTDSTGHPSGAIGCLTDVTESVRLREQLQRRASVDDLTACLNRRATLELLNVTLGRPEHGRAGTAVAFIDLDRFKPVNDCFGHLAGDRLLQSAASRLQRAVRDVDSVGRVGGDEFLVICPGIDGPLLALEIGERISQALHGTVDLGVGTVDLRASVGVAWTNDAQDSDSLIAQADSAMYEAKRVGNSTVALFAAGGSGPILRAAG